MKKLGLALVVASPIITLFQWFRILGGIPFTNIAWRGAYGALTWSEAYSLALPYEIISILIFSFGCFLWKLGNRKKGLVLTPRE
jgi:hypothetical protein